MTPKEFVKSFVETLAEEPDKIEVKEIKGMQYSIIELSVSKKDLGKVIGKQGKTAMAIRTLMFAMTRGKTRFEIVEN